MSPEPLFDRETLFHIGAGLLAIAVGVLSVFDALTVSTLLMLIGFFAIGAVGYIIGEKNAPRKGGI